MRNLNLNIAGYNIRFESSDEGPELVPGERFLRNITSEKNHDILIRVHTGRFKIPPGLKMVFNAPYVEEVNGVPVKKSDKFWSVSKHKDDLFIKTLFPLSDKKKKAILKFSLSSKEWDIWFEGAGIETDPLEYPLDGLILYYITVIHGDIMIHASGVNYAGQGYLFSGISGKGKTTLAQLWDKHGAKVIHDDRLIVRNSGTMFMMYNTPVYKNDVPSKSVLNKIFIIEHGKKNEIITVNGATGVSLVMANCIQHNWDPEIIAGLMGTVSSICRKVPVARLLFKPDNSVIEHILENE